MEVNFTLFAQMGNFTIAYCLLRYLFFKPALDVLSAKEDKLLSVKSELQRHEDDLVAQRQKVEFAWQQCCIYFKDTMPTHRAALSAPFCNIAPSFDPIVMSEQRCEQNQQELEHIIIKKVLHVRP